MTVKDDKLVGLRVHLERKVKYCVKYLGMAEADVWKAIYDIALRHLTLIYG